MPTKSDLIRQSEQGGRVREIRESLKLTGEAFGERLKQLAADAGLDASYGKDKVSRIESGRQPITAEEMVLISRLDRQSRGPEWLAFGDRAMFVGPGLEPSDNVGTAAPGTTVRKRKPKSA